MKSSSRKASTRVCYKIKGETFETIKDIALKYKVTISAAYCWIKAKKTDEGDMVRTITILDDDGVL